MKRKKRTTRQEVAKVKHLDPRIALFYSFFGGPLGQVYCGRFRRGIVLWLVILFIQLSILSSIATLPLGRIDFALLLLLSILAYPVFLCVDAFLLAKRYRTNPQKRYQRWWFYWLFFFCINIINANFAVGIKTFVAESCSITGESMAPPLRPGDHVLVDKLWYSHKRLKMNHLVVYNSAGPGSPAHIMRVVGLPGDAIEIKEEEVFVNGLKLEDKHANLSGKLLSPKQVNYGPVTVPLDSFFVLGDNRRIAFDSRFKGPVPLSDLIGRANMICWSRERHFPVKWDKSRYVAGPIAWARIGMLLK